MNKTAASAAH